MKVLGRVRCVLSAVLMVATLGVSIAGPVSAAEETPEYRLQLSPAALQVPDLKPGEIKEVKFKVQNTGSKVFDYEVTVTPYSVSGTDYKQNFTDDTNYTDIAKWVTFSQDTGTVEPDKQDEITATIKVPQDAPAGGQYAAIMVRMLNTKDEGNDGDGAAVSMYKQLGLIIYSDVAGNTRKEGKIIENKVPSFMFTPPISATSIVENTGNVHFEAKYILQVYPFFGGEEVYTNEENPATAVIMPETQRLNTVSWEGAPQLGIFKIKQTVKFLDQENVTEKVLFICPIWFLLIVLVVIFLIIFFIVSRIFGGKKGE